MDFLKKNYEKVILLGLFIVFIVVLLQLINIINRSKSTTRKDLELPKSDPDYIVADAKSDDFSFEQIIDVKKSWNRPRIGVAKNNSDFTQAYQITRCGHCGRLIPLSVLTSGGNCPLPACNKALAKYVPSKAGGQNSELKDTDRDGIPDLVEIDLNLKPYDPSDGVLDLDGDGFSNVFEYLKKTKLNDPLDHPPLYLGLSVDKIERQVLDMTLKGVEEYTDNRAQWTVQIETKITNPRTRQIIAKNEFKYIGADFKFRNDTYTVKSIDFKDEDAIIDGKAGKKRVYTVVITDKLNREILVVTDQVVYSPDDRIYFNSILDKKAKISGIVGSVLTLGNKDIGLEKYKITAMTNTQGKLTATLQDIKDEKNTFVVGRNPAIPEKQRAVIIEKDNYNDDGMGMDMDRNMNRNNRR